VPEKIESYRMLSNLIFAMIQPLPYSMQRKIYGIYSCALYQRKLSWLPSLFPGNTNLEVDDKTMELFIGKAEVIRNEELFKPYRKQYLPNE
jgi:hypothetical protein